MKNDMKIKQISNFIGDDKTFTGRGTRFIPLAQEGLEWSAAYSLAVRGKPVVVARRLNVADLRMTLVHKDVFLIKLCDNTYVFLFGPNLES